MVKVENNAPIAKEYKMKKIEYYSNEYILIAWPEVQDYMEEKWFRKECYLCQAFDDQEHIDSAYFVPKERVNEYNSKQLGE